MVLEERLKPAHSRKAYYAIEYEIDSNGCWNCTSHRPSKQGYLRVRRKGKLIMMHRYIYAKYVGRIPKGYCVMHTCDNRQCINPEHLQVGTIADNNYDMWQKGRGVSPPKGKYPESFKGREQIRHGEDNNMSILTAAQVMWIRAQPHERTHTSIAKELGVDRTTIALIRKGKTWKHLL